MTMYRANEVSEYSLRFSIVILQDSSSISIVDEYRFKNLYGSEDESFYGFKPLGMTRVNEDGGTKYIFYSI